MTDHDGLSEEEFDELLGIDMDIHPKNITLDMDYDSEPVLTVSIITKVFFRSITDKNAESDLQRGGENPHHPNNFSKCHLIPVPTIQYLNGRPPTEVNPPKIKKLVEKYSEVAEMLMKKAYNHDPSTKKGDVELEKKDKFKLDKFQASQLYTFKVPVQKWATAAKDFPIDLHRIRFSFSLAPIYAYTDDTKNPVSYEVMIPNRKSKGNARPVKGNFYPKISVKKFLPNAEDLVNENILEFDIHPNSLKIFGTHPRKPVTKKVNFVISFLMVRHVLGPALNTLAPIYVIAFLTPFTCFFDLEGAFDDIAGYLVTLLLALVAHRIVITEAQEAIQKFTMSDFDFAICTMIIVIQMIIFVVISSFAATDGGTRTDTIEEQMATTLGLDLQGGLAKILFAVEESMIILWILFRFVQIAGAFNRLVHANELDLLETMEEITIAEYRQLRADRRVLARDLKEKVFLKSLFSINLKILFQNALKPSDSKGQRLLTKLPTNDVFRCRFCQGKQANGALLKIQQNDKFDLIYANTIPKRPKNGIVPKTEADTMDRGANEAQAAKAVYSYSPAKGKTLVVEVQFLKDETVFTKKSHREYKVKRIEEALQVLQQNESTRLRMRDVIMMYLRSLIVEVFSMYKHNFWLNCTSDRELLWLMLREIANTNNIDSKAEHEDKKTKDPSKQIRNLLQTGNFDSSKHDADVDVQYASKLNE